MCHSTFDRTVGFAPFQAPVLADGDDLEEAEVYFGLEVLTRSLDISMDPNSYWQPNCRKNAASEVLGIQVNHTKS